MVFTWSNNLVAKMKIATLVGSLRAGSINLRLAKAVQNLARGRFETVRIPLADLPMYNDDLFTPEPPGAVSAFKNQIAAAHGVLFVMPEYNRSIPAVLKNAVDWGSRPYGRNSFGGKPAAIVGIAPGNIGTAVGQAHLRASLMVLDMGVMGQPEIYLKYTEGMFDAQDEVVDPGVRKLLDGFVDRFAIWCSRFDEPAAASQPGR